MKKKIYMIIGALFFVVTLSGCFKKGLEAEEAGALFVDHFIYQEREQEFQDNFIEGDLLSKQLLLMTNTFEDTFSDIFDPIITNLTVAEKEKLSSGLLKKVREISEYQVVAKKIDKKRVEVTYTINGLDYSNLVETTLDSIFKELMANESGIDTDSKKSLLKAFEQSLEGAKSVEREVVVSLLFEKNKNKWELSDNQDEELEELLFSFISGINDKTKYEQEMKTMLERVITNATEKL